MRAAFIIGMLCLVPTLARAATTADLIAALANRETAPAALDQLVAQGAAAIPALGPVASGGHDVTQRGWAIVGLRRIGGPGADAVMIAILGDAQQPVLVRTWAVAARVDLAPDFDALLALAPLVRAYPAARRPLLERIVALGSSGPAISLDRLLEAASQDVELQSTLAPLVLTAPTPSLVQAMLHAKTPQTRMLAAGYLASRGQTPGGAETVATTLVQSIAFHPGASVEPWVGGPLYVPGIAWAHGPARQLFGELVRWHVWAELRGRRDVQRQIDQSLNSIGLAGQAGYSPSWGDTTCESWLGQYAQVAGGREAVRKLLAEEGAAAEPRFQALLGSLK